MPFDAAKFWAKEQHGLASLLAMEHASVKRAEAYFGIRFPTPYLELLTAQNGGLTSHFVVPIRNDLEWYGDYLDVVHLNGIGTSPPQRSDFADYGAYDIYMTPYMIREWELPLRQVLLCGDGHTWITLDYRNGGEPVVTWIDKDPNNDQVIATSFNAFLDKLVPKDLAVDPESGALKNEFKLR